MNEVSLSERALILAPNGRDSQIAGGLLKEDGFPSETVTSLGMLVEKLEGGAGLVIIADEALRSSDLRGLTAWLDRQPPWSDVPMVILTRQGGGPERNPAAARLVDLLGNVSFVERPFHPTTLISVVRTAVRSRRRQYQARSLLLELAGERTALSDLTQTLEQRVEERTAALLREVAEREKAQDQLRQAQKMESLGQLTGGVAHDFNNLLMAVMGNMELLRKRVPDDARLHRLIDGALQGAKRGASLTQRLLAFARQQDLQVASVDIAILLQGMSNLLERSLGPQFQLRWSLAPDLPPALVDANQLELAILNLVINSRDAMPDGGTIDIGVYRCRPDRTGLNAKEYLCIRIADNGDGMDAETLKRAKEPFFSTKPVGKGTGLGLSMAYGLAEQLGGLLDLSSVVGAGTTVELWVPVANVQPEAAQKAEDNIAAGRPSIILVVDDDPLIAMSAVDMLEDLGHTVIEARSGKDALEIIGSRRPIDLLMTDHAMPGMTGVELAKASQQIRPALPVLLVTGYADLPNGEVVTIPRLGKPYHQDQLRAEISRLLPAE